MRLRIESAHPKIHLLIAKIRELQRVVQLHVPQHGDDLLGRTKMIIVDVERMTARREYDEFKTDYWYWEPQA